MVQDHIGYDLCLLFQPHLLILFLTHCVPSIPIFQHFEHDKFVLFPMPRTLVSPALHLAEESFEGSVMSLQRGLL